MSGGTDDADRIGDALDAFGRGKLVITMPEA
jgi:hypothetical protein